MQFTCVATSGACATVKDLEVHWSSSPLNLSDKQVNESVYPAEGRVSPLTILKQLTSRPLTSSALVSILTVWRRGCFCSWALMHIFYMLHICLYTFLHMSCIWLKPFPNSCLCTHVYTWNRDKTVDGNKLSECQRGFRLSGTP